jgi:hypothetical protein
VEHTDRDELRRLALWLARRRVVDEAVGTLTAYGPAASDRVHAHLDALCSLLEAEQAAFDALRRNAPRVPQLPLPELVDGHVALDGGPLDRDPYEHGPLDGRPAREATVHSIGAARDRHV